MKPSQRIRQTLQRYQHKPVTQQGVLGNEVGVISVPNRVDYVYVRVAGLGTISVYNKRVPLILDLPVDIGYDPLEPKNFQVLNIHRYPQGGGRSLVDVSTILHGKTHNWAGIDPVYIEKRQIMPLRPTPMGGMNIYVTREVTYYDDKAVLVSGQQLDLSPYVPATGSRMVLLYKDTDETIKVSTGGVLRDLFSLSLADAPQAYPGTVPIALVRLYGGQSGIAEGYQDTDLIDVRQLFSPIDLTGTGGAGGGHVIQDEGVSRTQRTNLNFKGSSIWAVDNAGDDSTDIIISGTSSDITGWISVKDYGAVGNGTDDDTTAISDAIAAIPSGGGVLYFPPGIYLTSGGFTFSNPTTIIGCGRGSANNGGDPNGVSTILCNSATAVLFTVAANHSEFYNLELKNTAATAPSAGAAITVTAGDFAVYKDLSIRGFYVDMDIQQGGEWVMDGCFFYGPVLYGLKIQYSDHPDAGDSHISNSTWWSADYDADAAIRIESGGGIKIVNCKINELSPTHRFVDGISLSVAASVNTTQLLISNCSIENITGNGINATTNASKPSTWRSIMICNSQFGLWANTSGNAIKLNANAAGELFEIVIHNCIFSAPTTSEEAIDLANCDKVTIGGSIYTGFSALYTAASCTNVVLDGVTTPATGLTDPTLAAGDMIYRTDVVGTNLATAAQGASATAINSNGSYTPDKAIDGNDQTYWAPANGQQMVGAWIKVDLGASKSFASFRLRQHASDPLYEASIWKIETSTDNVSYVNRGSYSYIAGDDSYNLTGGGVTARYIKITATAGRAEYPSAWVVRTIDIYDTGLPGVVRLPIGDEGNVLTVVSGIPSWEVATAGIVTGAHTIMDEGVVLPYEPILNFIGSSLWAVDNPGQTRTDIIISGTSSGGGHTIEDEGSALPQRSKLNFVGASVNLTDDAGNDRTIVTVSNITGSASGHTIRDETTPLTQRSNLSFKGGLVWAIDNAGDDSTDIIISGSAGTGGGAPTDAPYVTTAANANLSAEIVIPGLAGSADIAGAAGAGTSEEYDTATTGLTWSANAPNTVDSNTTIKSHLYVKSTDNAVRHGLKAWSPAGAFDARCKISIGSDLAIPTNDAVGLVVADADNSDGALIQLIAVSGTPYPLVIKCYTYAGTTYTQRGPTLTDLWDNEIYFRITRDGSNNVSFWWSKNGLLWILIVTQALTFTAAQLGFRVAPGSSMTMYMAVDWLRTDV